MASEDIDAILGITSQPDDAQELQQAANSDIDSILGVNQSPDKGEAGIRANIGEVKREFTKGAEATPFQYLRDVVSSHFPSTAELPEGAEDPYRALASNISMRELEAENDQRLDNFYGPGFSDPATTPEQRMKMILATREQAAKDIDAVYGSGQQDTWRGVIANVAGAMMDPTSLVNLPAMGYVKTAAYFGVLGGGTEALRQTAQEEEYDPVDIGVQTALTAAGGVVVKGAVQGLSKALGALVAKYGAQGTPIPQNAVDDVLRASGGPDAATVNSQKLTGELNSKFELNGTTPEEVLLSRNIDDDLGLSTTNFEVKLSDYYQGKAGQVLGDVDYYNTGSKPTDFGKLSKPELKAGGLAGPLEQSSAPKYINFDDDLSIYKGLGLEKEYDKATKTIIKKNKKTGKEYQAEIQVKNRPSFDQIEAGTFKGPARLAREGNPEDPAALDEALRLALAGKEEIGNYFKSVVYKGSPAYNGILKDVLNVNKPLSTIATSGDPESLVMEAINKKQVPFNSPTGQEIQPLVGKISDFDPDNPEWMKSWLTKYYEFAGHVWSDPYHATRSVNAYGKAYAKLMQDSQNAVDAANSRFIIDYKLALKENGIDSWSDQEELVAKVLRRTVDPKDVPPNVFKMAQFVKKRMDDQLDQAMKLGMISPEEHAALKLKSKEKGYFPRILDRDYLNTKAGQDQFVERISTAKFKSEQDVKNILKAYLGEKSAEASRVLYRETKDGRVYMIPSDLVKTMWQRQMLPQPDVRSVHLQAKRILPEEWEAVLEPFMQKDVGATLTKYMTDTNIAIEHAKRFGADDRILKELLVGIEKDSPDIMRMAQEAYYQQVGDFNSKNLQSFVQKPQWLRSTSRTVRALNTLKLITSPIMNITQVPSVGLPLMTNKTYSPAWSAMQYVDSTKQLYRSVGGLLKGIKSNFDPQMKLDADRAGAAAATMTTEMLAGFNEAGHTILGKKITTPALYPLEILNNPTLFLKYNGFTSTEIFNRRLAYWMGRSYTEGLIEDYVAALAKGNRVNPERLKGMQKRLWEVGIDPSSDLSKVTSADIDMAAKAISDEINFSGSSYKMPLVSQSFHGKIFYQFKNFTLNMSGHVLRNIIQPAIKGNLMPLATFMGVGLGLMPVADFHRWVLQDDKEYTFSQRYIMTLTNLGGIMAIGGILQRAGDSSAALLEFGGGPTYGMASSMLSDFVKSGVSSYNDKDQQAKDNLAKGVTRPLPSVVRKPILKAIAEDKDAFNKSFEVTDKEQDLSKGM